MNNADGSPTRRTTAARMFWLCLFGLSVMVLADSHAATTKAEFRVIFALDISDSIDDVDRMTNYLTDLVNLRAANGAADRRGLIVFGKYPAVELPPTHNWPLENLQTQIDRG